MYSDDKIWSDELPQFHNICFIFYEYQHWKVEIVLSMMGYEIEIRGFSDVPEKQIYSVMFTEKKDE